MNNIDKTAFSFLKQLDKNNNREWFDTNKPKFWDPNKEDLFRIRKELEMDAEEFCQILSNKTLQKAWGRLEGGKVKTAPKGFSKEHPNIQLIRHKQFIFRHSYTDKQVLQNTFYEDVLYRFQAIRPFFDFMSAVLTTDLNGVSLLED